MNRSGAAWYPTFITAPLTLLEKQQRGVRFPELFPSGNNHFIGEEGSCMQVANLESRSNELVKGLNPAAQHHHFPKGQELIQIHRLMVTRIPSPESR